MKCWYCDKIAKYARKLVDGTEYYLCAEHRDDEDRFNVEMGRPIDSYREL